MTDLKQEKADAQAEALRKLHRLGVWKEVKGERESCSHFNDWWYSVAYAVDTWKEYEQHDWVDLEFMSVRSYTSAIQWLNKYRNLLDVDFEVERTRSIVQWARKNRKTGNGTSRT